MAFSLAEILGHENWRSGYVELEGKMQNFFSVFSIYFPAGIGILAATNISGGLKMKPFSLVRNSYVTAPNIEVILSKTYSRITVVPFQ